MTENHTTALIAQYRATRYNVRAPNCARIMLRIGQTTTALPIEPGERFGFITAWNPRSQPRSAALNRIAQRELLAALRRTARTVLPGVGRSADGCWREPSLLAIGIALDTLDALARRFGQNAVVTGIGSGGARLRIYRADWRGAAHGPDLEWA